VNERPVAAAGKPRRQWERGCRWRHTTDVVTRAVRLERCRPASDAIKHGTGSQSSRRDGRAENDQSELCLDVAGTTDKRSLIKAAVVAVAMRTSTCCIARYGRTSACVASGRRSCAVLSADDRPRNARHFPRDTITQQRSLMQWTAISRLPTPSYTTLILSSSASSFRSKTAQCNTFYCCRLIKI